MAILEIAERDLLSILVTLNIKTLQKKIVFKAVS